MKQKLLSASILFLSIHSQLLFAQAVIHKDTIVYKFIYRDTIVYKHDTIRIRHFVYSDTAAAPYGTDAPATGAKKKRLINPNAWGIGPSVGAYYSPFNGFDINFGFGVQYYFLAIPSFRNPHMKSKSRVRHR